MSEQKQPEIKLTYFNIKGLAEMIRLTLTLGGIEFEDIRMDYQEFMKLKEGGTLPFGQLPVLTVDGKNFSQSQPLLRYAMKLAGTYPSDPLAALELEEVLEAIRETFQEKIAPTMRMDAAEKKVAREKYASEYLPARLAIFEKRIAANGSGWMVGDSYTPADFYVAAIHSWLASGIVDHIPASIFEAYPLFNAISAKVDEIPAVKEYYASKK